MELQVSVEPVIEVMFIFLFAKVFIRRAPKKSFGILNWFMGWFSVPEMINLIWFRLDITSFFTFSFFSEWPRSFVVFLIQILVKMSNFQPQKMVILGFYGLYII